MAAIIPNQNSYIAFKVGDGTNKFGFPVTNGTIGTVSAAALGTDLTDFIISINATTSGNSVPTPRIKRLFETNIPGTASATFTTDMYRDDINDTAWTTLPRNTSGSFVISRFGGTGADKKPVAAQTAEVWPVTVISRGMAAMQNGAAQMFTVTCSVPVEPDENKVLAA